MSRFRRWQLSRAEIRSYIGASPAARLADEPGLNVGQANVVGPAIGAQSRVVTARGVSAADQDVLHAHFSHFAEGDLHWPAVGMMAQGGVASTGLRHAAIETPGHQESNYQSLGLRNARELLLVVGVEMPSTRYIERWDSPSACRRHSLLGGLRCTRDPADRRRKSIGNRPVVRPNLSAALVD